MDTSTAMDRRVGQRKLELFNTHRPVASVQVAILGITLPRHFGRLARLAQSKSQVVTLDVTQHTGSRT
jgi:hypothetical protein